MDMELAVSDITNHHLLIDQKTKLEDELDEKKTFINRLSQEIRVHENRNNELSGKLAAAREQEKVRVSQFFFVVSHAIDTQIWRKKYDDLALGRPR